MNLPFGKFGKAFGVDAQGSLVLKFAIKLPGRRQYQYRAISENFLACPDIKIGVLIRLGVNHTVCRSHFFF